MKNLLCLLFIPSCLLFTASCSHTNDPATSDPASEQPASSRDKLVGTWRLTETNSRSGKHTYDLMIAAGSGPNDIVVTEPNGELSGTVNGESFTIPQVSIDDSLYSATGKLDGDQLTYQSLLTGRDVERHSSGILLNDGRDITCKATGTRVDTSTVDPDRANFIDTWMVVKEGQSSEDAYELTMMAGSGGNEIILKNLTNVEAAVDRGKKGIRIGYPTEEEIFATIENDSIVIPQQWHDGTKYSGSGTLNGDTIGLKVSKDDYGPKIWKLVGKRKGTALPAAATRDDYIGTWGHPVKVYMDIEIEAGDEANEIRIKNFWRPRYSGVTVTATVDGNKFTVPEQEIDGFTISGTGAISGIAELDTLTFDCTTLWVSPGKRESRRGGSFKGYRK